MTALDSKEIGHAESYLDLHGSTKPDRYLAACIDNTFAFLLVMGVAMGVSDYAQTGNSTAVNAVLGFAVFCIYFAYFLLFEALFSTTPGKLMFSLVVRNLDGTKCTWRAATIRTSLRFLEVNPFLFGCLPAALIVRNSQRKQRWGDMLANTVVISTGSQIP